MTTFMGYRIQDETAKKIEKYESVGYSIIIGNTIPRSGISMDNGERRQKSGTVYGKTDAVLLSQVNSRKHGKCIRTIWAVR